MIEKPNISLNFTIDDIHKIREYHYELTKTMTPEERRDFYKKGSDEAQCLIEKIRAAKNPLYVRQKIELGKDAAQQGKVYSKEEARRLMQEQ